MKLLKNQPARNGLASTPKLTQKGILQGLEAERHVRYIDAVIVVTGDLHEQIAGEGDDAGCAFSRVEGEPDEYISAVACAGTFVRTEDNDVYLFCGTASTRG